MTKPAEVIRALARAQDIPQTRLAGAAGLGWGAWQRRMSGAVDWRLDELRAVALALDVPLARLIGEVDDR